VSWKHIKIFIFLKLDFYTSKKSINRSGYVMKGKMELLTNFNFISIPMVEISISKSMQFFFFLKIVKIEPANKIQSFF
jgi:hypothetical protein